MISCWFLNHKQFYFIFYYVLFNKGHSMCDENNPSSKIRLCYKDIDYVIEFPHYSKLYNILWLWMSHIVGYWMKIGLLRLLFTFLISLYWEEATTNWNCMESYWQLTRYAIVFSKVNGCLYFLDFISWFVSKLIECGRPSP
jgi:hypothetical protein